MKRVIFWATRLIIAVILLQTLYFKFTGADESVEMFSTIGIEPWGRYLTGILELIASVLVIIPATVWLGSLLSLGLMAGALLMHALFLGIEVAGDGGTLFVMALVVFIASFAALWLSRDELPEFISRRLKV